MGGDGEYYGSADQNIWMIDQMREHGYRKGTNSATQGIHLTDEDGLGSEVIFSKKYGTLRQLDAGDTVFSKEQVQKLWDMSKDITPNMGLSNISAKLPDMPSMRNNNQSINNNNSFNIEKIVADNPEEFARQLGNALASDSRVQKIINENVSNAMLGRNSLSTRKYIR